MVIITIFHQDGQQGDVISYRHRGGHREPFPHGRYRRHEVGEGEEDGSGSRDEPLQPSRGVAEFHVDRLVNIYIITEVNELTDDGVNFSSQISIYTLSALAPSKMKPMFPRSWMLNCRDQVM